MIKIGLCCFENNKVKGLDLGMRVGNKSQHELLILILYLLGILVKSTCMLSENHSYVFLELNKGS